MHDTWIRDNLFALLHNEKMTNQSISLVQESCTFRSPFANRILEATNAVHGHQSLEADTGGNLGLARLLGTDWSSSFFFVELALKLRELGVHDEQFLLEVLLQSSQAVHHALDVELFLHLRQSLAEFANHVSVGLELVKLALDAGYLLESAVGGYQLKHDLADLLFVHLLALLAWDQKVADLHFLPEFLDVTLEGVDFSLDLEVLFVEGSDGGIDFAEFMGIQVLHQFLEIVAEFQIGDHFGDPVDLVTCRFLTFGKVLDLLRGNDSFLFHVFDPSADISHSDLQVPKLLLVLQLLLSDLPSIGQIQLDVVLDLIYPSLYLHHLNLQLFLQFNRLALQVVDHFRIDVALYHRFFDLVHDPQL